MRLTERDRNIFVHAELAADTPLAKIARHAGHKSHTVRYCLNRMLERRLVYRQPVLNLTALGFDEYLVYFSLASEHGRIRSAFLQTVQQSQRVRWMMELGGDYQFVMGIMARSPSELSHFMDELANKFGNLFFHKAVSVVVCSAYYGRRYLSPNKPSGGCLIVEDVPNAPSFDEIDHQILIEICRLDFDSLRSVARKTGLPMSTLRYRIKKMETYGLIAGSIFVLAKMLEGIQSFRVLVYAKGFNAELHQRLFSFCEKQANVIACLKTLGNWDYEIRVEVERSHDMAPLLRSLYDHFNSDINRLKCESVIGILKPTCYPVRDFALVDLKRTPRP